MIPKIVHHVWLGGDAPRSHFTRLDGWEINIIDEDVIRKLWGIPTDGDPVFVSNLVKFLAVRDFGGMYADIDLAPLDDFSDFLHLDFFGFKIQTTRNPIPNFTSNQLFGSVKNGRIVRAWSEHIIGLNEPRSKIRISETNGSVAFSSFMDQLELLPSEVLMPGGLARRGPAVKFRAVELSGSPRIPRT